MKLRIAQVGSLYENTPPALYGGTERIVSSLTEGLVSAGHNVTLFATGESKTEARLICVCPKPLAQMGIGKTNFTYPLLNFNKVLEMEKEFDIIHFHLSLSSDYISLLIGNILPYKSIYTIHFVSPALKNYPDRMKLLAMNHKLNYVSISDAARNGFGNLNWVQTIYNGIEIDQFTFQPQPQDYFAWIGKFNPDKGVKEAILAAKKAGVKLKLAGTVDREDVIKYQYFELEIKPLIDGKQIEYVGEKGGKEKDEFLGNAIGFLNPILWNEPFGLVSAEAMATGTPVISFNKGALNETVKNGLSGYLVEDLYEMTEKIKAISAIKRSDCRKWVEDNFTATQMVENYESVYKQLLANV